MNRFRFWRSLTVLALGGAALCGSLTSAQASGNPAIRVVDGVEYMSGGGNPAEWSFLQTVSSRWSMALEFAVNRGPRNAFPADVKVSVHDKHTGRPVIETTVSGPVMLARLEVGTYDVRATVGNLTLTQSLTVFEGASAKALFLWPSNFDFASVTSGADQQQAVKRADPVQSSNRIEPAVTTRDRQAAAKVEHD